jgi:hypothetical protein
VALHHYGGGNMSKNFSVGEALDSLGIKEWVLGNEPTNEVEFLQYFSKVVGVDENQNVILSNNPQDFGVTWSEIDAEVARLTALEPARIATENRRAAYIAEADPLFFKAQRGEATMEEWQAKVAEIKQRFPKSE